MLSTLQGIEILSSCQLNYGSTLVRFLTSTNKPQEAVMDLSMKQPLCHHYHI